MDYSVVYVRAQATRPIEELLQRLLSASWGLLWCLPDPGEGAYLLELLSADLHGLLSEEAAADLREESLRWSEGLVIFGHEERPDDPKCLCASWVALAFDTLRQAIRYRDHLDTAAQEATQFIRLVAQAAVSHAPEGEELSRQWDSGWMRGAYRRIVAWIELLV